MSGINHKGLLVAQWNRYFRVFNKHLKRQGYWRDLQQEMELIVIESKQYTDIKEIGRFQAKRLRQFLKSIGFRKRDGKFILREHNFSDQWWDCVGKENKTPDNFDLIYTIYDYFNGQIRRPRKPK